MTEKELLAKSHRAVNDLIASVFYVHPFPQLITKDDLLRIGIDIRTDGEKFRDKVQKEWERRMNDRNK